VCDFSNQGHHQGHQIAVATVTELNETHVFAASEARALGEENQTRIGQDLLV